MKNVERKSMRVAAQRAGAKFIKEIDRGYMKFVASSDTLEDACVAGMFPHPNNPADHRLFVKRVRAKKPLNIILLVGDEQINDPHTIELRLLKVINRKFSERGERWGSQ